MEKTRMKTFHIDGDLLTIPYHYDEGAGIYIGCFPEFDDHPRYTPNGRPWKSVVSIGCLYAAGDYDDCGSCSHLIKVEPSDLIGVCFHERMRRGNSPVCAPEDEKPIIASI